MKKCADLRKNIYLYYHGELSGREKKELEEHVVLCADCAARLERVKNVLKSANEETVPEQSAEFWEDYDAGLEKKLERRRFPVLIPRFEIKLFPRLATAAAAVLLAVVIFVKFVPAPDGTEKMLVGSSVEEELFLQEMALLTELGEDFDLPLPDDELIKEIELIESIDPTRDGKLSPIPFV